MLIFSIYSHNSVKKNIIHSEDENASLKSSSDDEECKTCSISENNDESMDNSEISEIKSDISEASVISMGSNNSTNISIEQTITMPVANNVSSEEVSIAKESGRVPWFSQVDSPERIAMKQKEVIFAMSKFKRQEYCDKVCSNWLGQWLVHTDCKCPPMNMNGKSPVWGCQNGKTLNHLTGKCICKKSCDWMKRINLDSCKCVPFEY